ncbi:MAG: topoisomerase C-terminal repeat-containing protein, partial [Rhodothermales bacterium]
KKGVDDVLTVELARALDLLSEKEKKNQPLRVLGDHPKTGEAVEIWGGRYGPYVKHQKTNASLPKDLDVEDVSMSIALDLLAEREKKGGKKRRSSRKKK